MITPIISGCSEQKYGNDPEVSNTWLNVLSDALTAAPDVKSPSKVLLVPLTTLCKSVSAQIHLTVSPTVMVIEKLVGEMLSSQGMVEVRALAETTTAQQINRRRIEIGIQQESDFGWLPEDTILDQQLMLRAADKHSKSRFRDTEEN